MSSKRRIQSLATITVVFAGCACGPYLRLQPHGETIQDQCGVSYGVTVTKEQAICIAKLGGLEQTVRRWSVEEHSPDGKEAGTGYWWICNTIEPPHSTEGGSGDCWGISKKDGKIVSTGSWKSVTLK